MNEEKSFFEGMFENVGNKIKIVAQILCYIGIVGYIIAGIVMLVKAADSYYDEELYNILGWTFLILGPIASWLNSLLLYGFGVIVNNNDVCANKKDYIEKNIYPKQTPNNEKLQVLDELLKNNLISKDEYEEKVKVIINE